VYVRQICPSLGEDGQGCKGNETAVCRGEQIGILSSEGRIDGERLIRLTESQ